MPFRFSTTFFGRPIVQVSAGGGKWLNFDPPPGPDYHFNIVRVDEFKAMLDRIAKADKHAAACRKGRAKKRLPVLKQEVPRAEIERYARATGGVVVTEHGEMPAPRPPLHRPTYRMDFE